LTTCLSEERIAGAGLDVFVAEPLPVDHPLGRLDNVVLAPHTGGGSGGGQRKLIGQVLENIARVAKGKRPLHQVESGQF
jgi:D-3-phosphoglycerate dehydrogenase